ncbi:uncharacterized protein LOC109723567 [Ananas comosus]|uniref:Uncharacterized protein LOC109723567 n=1 Tax=Ananas comosus TaxID=4615 RepID=A0A6P5GI11_ANACO|nr:uncharacterized protein LOC109723567 [Ananas comosus]XP_020107584.1 uncharacterized protein LOC109723567 [Ananas comosus]
MESARDARRRRILERGSNRLAFITGESPSLPPKPEDEVERGPKTTTVASLSENGTPVIEAAEQWKNKEDEAYQGVVDTGDISEKSEQTDQTPEPHLNDEIMKHGIKNDAPTLDATTSSSLNRLNIINDKEVRTSSMAHSQPDRRLPGTALTPSVAHSKNHSIFTWSRISHSISASENIRLLLAVAIAFLVILSNHQYNISGGLFRGMICSRPLLLVLLTDASIVLGRLMVIKSNDQKEEKTRARNNDNGSADSIGRTLEVGLVFQKAMRSFFMDCIICAVIMICGLRV